MPNTISTKEAAEILNVSERTIRNMIKRGSINAQKMDPNAKSVYRISRADVEKILKERTAPTHTSQ